MRRAIQIASIVRRPTRVVQGMELDEKAGICAGLIANMVRCSATDELESNPNLWSVRILTLQRLLARLA